MDTDRNLLFGVLALHLDLIDTEQFARACSASSASKDKSLGKILVDQGLLTDEDRTEVKQPRLLAVCRGRLRRRRQDSSGRHQRFPGRVEGQPSTPIRTEQVFGRGERYFCW
jgi:hypothetical protein